jgi:ABC-type lipoprotein export system ATPase subunit
MLTRLRVRNFKRFDDIDIELGKAVVFVGPNNSGKTTALQALALWDIGVRRWNEKRKGKATPEKRSGVTINRRDLIAIPIPDANLLWRRLHVRDVEQVVDPSTGKPKPKTENVRIDVIVDGVTDGKEWSCGIEFDYANDESFYCRPLRTGNGSRPARMAVPAEAADVRVAFLPPMSGLAAVEPKWEPGRINVLIGEGQTAQVLRNLCFQIHSQTGGEAPWKALTDSIRQLFGVNLLPPRYIAERGEITMAYQERQGIQLDLSSAGRGLQQTLLLLAHLYANPRTVLLLDEPDAHLEILRQRQIYQKLTDVAHQHGSQVVIATHSEVVLNEAADRDIVIAFVGQPHRIDDRGFQVSKALKEIGFEDYYNAEIRGWVLYLEGPTDLAILRALAQKLGHKAALGALEAPFVRYVGNVPGQVRSHFHGLREATRNLVGIAIFDRLETEDLTNFGPQVLQWHRREIENYLCAPEVLVAYAAHDQPDDLFGKAEAERRQELMRRLVADRVPPIALRNRNDDWWSKTKMSDEFLDPLFVEFFKSLSLPNVMRKSDYHELARFLTPDQIDSEVGEKLDAISNTAARAQQAES